MLKIYRRANGLCYLFEEGTQPADAVPYEPTPAAAPKAQETPAKQRTPRNKARTAKTK